MSMSDFAPKRFALKYDPIPMIGKFAESILAETQEGDILVDFILQALINLSQRILYSLGVPSAIDRQAIPSQDEAQAADGGE